MKNKPVINYEFGEKLLYKFRLIKSRLVPLDTRRFKIYQWINNNIKKIIGVKSNEALGESILFNYRKVKNKLFPEISFRYKIYKLIAAIIKNFISRPILSIIHLLSYLVSITKRQTHLISVVIPVYDRTDILETAIESILDQTYKNFELLLICDGSPPETLDVIKKYQDHPKVRIFKYRDNSGSAVRARNRGIQVAKGKYVAFLDSDDIAEPRRLEISCKYAERNNADVLYGDYMIIKTDEDHSVISDRLLVNSEDCSYNSLQRINAICQSTVLVRTDVLRKSGGLKMKMHYCEDYELWLRLAYLGYKFFKIPCVLTILRLHSGNFEDTFIKEKEKWQQKALSEHKVIPKQKPSVAFIIPGEGLSGGIMVICQHANRLIKKGYHVVLINHNPIDPFKLDWFPGLLPEIIPLNKLDNNIDIAIATQWSTAYTALKISAKRKLYFIQSDETRFNPPDSTESELARQTYTFYFEFVVIAKWLKKWLKEQFNKDAHYVPNGLDTSLFYLDEPLEPKNERLRVLLEGPIDIPFKGMKEAFQVVNGMDCEVWCVSSAGKPMSDWHCDRFFERVPLQEMRRIYCSCDVLIKMTKVEGFFMPPLEMMACGGTVITNKVTGYDEYIKDGYNGLVVEQGDVVAARAKLSQLIQNRDLLERLKEGGRETSKNWTWEESNKRFEKILVNKMFQNTSV